MSRPGSYLRVAALLPLLKLLFGTVVNALPTSLQPRQFHPDTSIWSKPAPEESGAGWFYLVSAVILVLLGGVFAGLTIALMGQDEIYLQVLASSGEESERKNASKVLRLMKRGKHWVLVSLLLSNVITNETLPIMLDRSLGGGWQAVVGSTVLIVIFGEVVPQSICVRFGLPIGAFMSSSVILLMWILAPVAWPTAKLLDWLLGEDHGTTYKKAGLKTLVTLHRTLGTSPDERLNHDEVTIISAVLDLKAKPVGSIMTPMEDVFTLSADTVLDDDMMNTILSEGYSRIPIYAIGDPDNFIGMLLVKMLITYDPEDCSKVEDFHLATLPETRPETSCLDIINFFQEGKSHMILVSESPGEPTGVLGVCTLEDVIEELIGEEIVDESDVFVDVHKAIRRMNPVPYYRLPKTAQTEVDQHGALDENDLITKAVSHTMERKLSAISDINLRGQGPKLIRRRNSGGTENVAMQKKSEELRAHLKHLGPSNLASKPKTTRINAVKIKPGLQSTTSATVTSPLATPQASKLKEPNYERSSSRTSAPGGSGRENTAPNGKDESTSLLAAGFQASDGAHAVGYGTLSSSPTAKARLDPADAPLVPHQRAALIQRTKSEYPPSSKPILVEVGPTDLPTKSKDEQNFQSQVVTEDDAIKDANQAATRDEPAPLKNNLLSLSQGSNKAASTSSLPAKLIINPEQDAAPSDDEAANPDENSSGSTVKSSTSFGGISRKNTARSGSIQEREIPNLSGVRKMVLDVHNEEESDSGRRPSYQGRPSHSGNEESSPLLSGSGVIDGSEDGGAAAGDKKKKRKKKRSKKKKTPKEGESGGGVDV